MGLSTATYAWFTVNTFAGVEDFEMEISTGQQLLVSMENHGSNLEMYTDTITNEMIDSYLSRFDTSIEEMILAPVTTNNGKTFTYEHGSEATANRAYLEFDCYFIGTCDMWVHLTTEGDVDGSNKGTEVTSSSPAPQSEVTQAVRMDFDTESDGVATYEPGKGTPATALNTFDLPSGEMDYQNSNRLFHLDELTPKKVTVRLWAEGEDPQCDDDIKEANLRIQLSFIGCDDNNVPIS